MRTKLCCGLILGGWLLFSPILQALPGQVDAFLDQHCYECHDDVLEKGGLNLLDLSFELGDKDNLQQWIQVFDRARTGEMPPKDETRPDPEVLESFLADLKSPLAKADGERIAEQGRSRVRRLNREEFETTLSDLFQMPLNIQPDLPEDARSHGFDTVGAALNVSSVQMEAWLGVLDKVLDQATTLHERPETRNLRLTFRESNGIMQVYRRGGPFVVQEDGVAFFATEKFSHLNAVLGQYTVPYAGKYRVKVSAYAMRSEEPVILSLRAGGTGHAESNHVPHVFLEHFSVVEGEPEVFEWEGELERGHYLHVYPTSLRPMRFAGRKEEGKQKDYEGPGVVVQWVDVEGPFLDQWPPASHQRLWGDVKMERLADAEPNRDPIEHLMGAPDRIAQPRMTRTAVTKETGNKFIYDPSQPEGGELIYRDAPIPKSLHDTWRLVSEEPRVDARRLLHDFASAALRGPVSSEDVQPALDLVERWLEEGSDFEEAMRVGYKALLASPRFLYHQGTLPGDDLQLNDEAIAERLAFFLWNSGPDETLSELAAAGNLRKEGVLRAQVERMLKDERAERFLTHLLDQWLDLRLIDFTVPDDALYPEHDQLLEWSMVEETRGFFRELLEKDLSVAKIVDSDFAMVNWRLARHYGLPSVFGMDVRPVPLPADSVRGGVLTQSSVLKVTANGTTTSPVVRGTWVLERIMGTPPQPPPPGIPAIEPDIRGATTVRELLEAHREAESCAGCHAVIDPPGIALESFDVIGGWRERYRAINPELEDLRFTYNPNNPPPTRYVDALPVNAGYAMADGRAFDDIEDFKALLLEDPRQIARGVAEKLLIYSTGAEISFSDRDELEAILDDVEEHDYGFRTMIHAIVQSPFFHRK